MIQPLRDGNGILFTVAEFECPSQSPPPVSSIKLPPDVLDNHFAKTRYVHVMCCALR